MVKQSMRQQIVGCGTKIADFEQSGHIGWLFVGLPIFLCIKMEILTFFLAFAQFSPLIFGFVGVMVPLISLAFEN